MENLFRFTNELVKARALLDEAKTIFANLDDWSDGLEMDTLETADERPQRIIDAIDGVLVFERKNAKPPKGEAEAT